VSVELRMLSFSVVLGIVQIIAASHAASLQRGYKWTASSRDEKVEPLRGVAGRLDRALGNFVKTFPLFAAVVLVAHLTDTHDGSTAVLLGSCGLRASICGRGPADPFAGVERRHDRHLVDRRCSAVWMNIRFSGLGRGGLITCEILRIHLPRASVNRPSQDPVGYFGWHDRGG
jgi:hypothetical protein